jgi:hypothetical protein
VARHAASGGVSKVALSDLQLEQLVDDAPVREHPENDPGPVGLHRPE